MKKVVISLCSILLVAGAGHTQAFSDTFSAAALGLGVGNPTLVSGANTWTMSGGGNLDVIGFGGFIDPYPGNNRYVDLDGTGGVGSTTITSQGFSLLANTNYALSFKLGKNGSTAESMVVSVLGSSLTPIPSTSFVGGAAATGAGSIPSFIVQSGATFNWFQSLAVPVANIQFAHVGSDSQGYIIDDVLLVGTAGGAPEPASLALIGMFGVPFLGLLRRRK